jgi:hypothetical protein
MKKILYILIAVIPILFTKPICVANQKTGIYPSPHKVIERNCEVILDENWKIAVGEISPDVYFSAKLLKKNLINNNLNLPIEPFNVNDKNKKIFLYIPNDNVIDEIGEEGYILDVKTDAITISANNPRGVFYGVQSLIQLIAEEDREKIKITSVKIVDYPKTQIRGVHINAANLEKIKKQLDLLAELKMNLAIIETWDYFRLEEKDNLDKLIEVYEYARQRYIEPVPEIVSFSHAAPFFILDSSTAEGTWVKDQTYIFDNNYAQPYSSKVYPLLNVIREENSNIIITNQEKNVTYKENEDYVIFDGELLYPYGEENKATQIKRTLKGRIKENQKVLISFNRVKNIKNRWISWSIPYCPASNNTYKIIEDVLSNVITFLSPKYISIGHDEIIGMNKDQRTLKMQMTNAELLAFDINTIYDITKLIDPNVKLMMWDDMLNPWHNGGNDDYQKPFGGKIGATSKAVEMIPNDIIILIWWYENKDRFNKMKNSISFFSNYGFPYLVAAWKNQDNISKWMEIIDEKDHANGFIITTWDGFDENYKNINSVAGQLWTANN